MNEYGFHAYMNGGWCFFQTSDALKYPIVPKYCDLWQVGSFSGYSRFLHRGEDFIS